MADAADIAGEWLDRRQVELERRLVTTMKPVRQHVEKREHMECSECGDAIPRERRQAIPGCRLCTECQQLAEQYNRELFRSTK